MISANTRIRNSIYEIAKDSKLLSLSGRTEMEKEVDNTLRKIRQYAGTSTFDSTNFEMDESELKNYVEKVIHELRKKQNL
jgi:hypothetical protein